MRRWFRLFFNFRRSAKARQGMEVAAGIASQYPEVQNFGDFFSTDQDHGHARAIRFFAESVPEEIRAHRALFAEGRGFGEPALHAMWWLLLRDERPKRMLEIGVHQGQVLSLWGVTARSIGYDVFLAGISPFDGRGDTVSRYESVDYIDRVQAHFRLFGLPQPELTRCRSTDVEAVRRIRTGRWHLVYVDGSHDVEIVRQDAENSIEGLVEGGLLVLDDAALATGFAPPWPHFAGHAGPSAIAQDLIQHDDRVVHIGFVGHNAIFRRTDVR